MENSFFRLRFFFHTLDMSQTEVAERLGVSIAQINLMLNEKRPITNVMALAIEAKFGIRAKWLLEGEGEMYGGERVIDPTPELDEIIFKYGFDSVFRELSEMLIDLPKNDLAFFIPIAKSFLKNINPEELKKKKLYREKKYGKKQQRSRPNSKSEKKDSV